MRLRRRVNSRIAVRNTSQLRLTSKLYGGAGQEGHTVQDKLRQNRVRAPEEQFRDETLCLHICWMETWIWMHDGQLKPSKFVSKHSKSNFTCFHAHVANESDCSLPSLEMELQFGRDHRGKVDRKALWRTLEFPAAPGEPKTAPDSVKRPKTAQDGSNADFRPAKQTFPFSWK